MKAKLPCLVLAALLSGGACAQSIMEHAAAAAGATAGTAGGKVLSNVIDSALSKAASNGGETHAPAAKQPARKAEADAGAIAAPKPQAGGPDPSSSTSGYTRRVRPARASSVAKPAFPTENARLSAPVFAQTPPPSIEDFQRVKEGAARQDVFGALGTPSSHVTIPDDGHLIEIMSYSDGRRRVGTVRLDNGQVISVATEP